MSGCFSDFRPKNFKKFSKLPSTCVEEQFVAWNCFLYFESFWIFWRNLWHGSQNSIYVFRVKIAEELIFLFFFSEFFSEFERKAFRLSAKKLQEIVKTTFRVCGWTNFGLGFFLKCFEPFWIFCRNLWHGSQNSIYVSRVKIAEEMVFLFFFSDFFRILSKIFSDFWPKNFKMLTKLPSASSDEQFLAWNFFQKFWAVLDFLRKIWHGSQTSIFMSREKILEEIIFFILLFRFFFGVWAKLFFRFLAKKLQEVVKTNFCVCRRIIFNLKVFSKVLNRFWYSAETFGMVLKLLSSCPQ